VFTNSKLWIDNLIHNANCKTPEVPCLIVISSEDIKSVRAKFNSKGFHDLEAILAKKKHVEF
jgi:hypothetical protein